MTPLHDLIPCPERLCLLFSPVMCQLSGLSDSRPSSSPSPRLSPLDSPRGWQRSARAESSNISVGTSHGQHSCKFVVFRSHCGRAWRPTPARWCVCARRRTTTSGRASTHCRWSPETRLSLPPFSFRVLRLHHTAFSCVLSQFLHGRGLKRVDLKTIQCVSVGQKDQNKGLFHLWQEIFQLPRTKR